MGPWQIWHDLRRTGRAVVALVRYLRSRETIDIALGEFEAASSTVVVGQPCGYVVRIANVSQKVWDVKLILEIAASTSAHSAAHPSARFAKYCAIPPSRAMEIEFHYDWRTAVALIVDKVPSIIDECWVGEIKTLQRYSVSAILSDPTGKLLDTLGIYQELQG